MGDYKELIAWQKAHENTLQIVRLVDALPNTKSAWVIGKQLIRAAGSRGANLAEGHGRQMLGRRGRDYRNFLEIALGSVQETEHWLLLTRDTGLVAPDAVAALLDQNMEVRKMLCAIVRRVECAGNLTPDA